MRDEGVIYVAGHPLLNRRCTRLPGCIRLRNDLYCVEWGVKLYSLTVNRQTLKTRWLVYYSVHCRQSAVRAPRSWGNNVWPPRQARLKVVSSCEVKLHDVMWCGAMWCGVLVVAAGVDGLRASESEPHESIRVQLAGATSTHSTAARATVDRTCKVKCIVRSPTDVSPWRRLRRFRQVTPSPSSRVLCNAVVSIANLRV